MEKIFLKAIERSRVKLIDTLSYKPLEGTAVIRGVINKKEVILKIAKLSNKSKTKTFLKELEVDKKIKLFCPNLLVPHILEVGKTTDCVWIIRQYFKGNTLDGLLPNNRIDLMKKIILAQKTLSSIDCTIFNNYPTRFSQKIKSYSNFSKYFNISLNRIETYYNSVISDYLQSKNTVTVSADFTPNNIIITDNEGIILSDFEWLCCDNYTFDLAMLWLFLYKNKNLQEIIQNELKKESDKNYFRISLIRIVLAWYSEPKNAKSSIKKVAEKRKVWINYLLNASKSFEELIK